MPNRGGDWFRQALRDLEQAEESRERGKHEWACFAAHQAAEKAVKALHLHFGQEAWGHVVARLLRELPPEVRPHAELVEKARVLDNFYVPTRYPNAHPSGSPKVRYTKTEAERLIGHAQKIIEFCEGFLSELGS